MDVRTGLFYLFSLVLLFAAFRVITARNPVYAALFLVLSGLAPNYPLLLIFWCGVQLGANFALAAHHIINAMRKILLIMIRRV